MSAILFQNEHWDHSFKNRYLKGSAQSRDRLNSRRHSLNILNIYGDAHFDYKEEI